MPATSSAPAAARTPRPGPPSDGRSVSSTGPVLGGVVVWGGVVVVGGVVVTGGVVVVGGVVVTGGVVVVGGVVVTGGLVVTTSSSAVQRMTCEISLLGCVSSSPAFGCQ